jgi:hypothetical protein
MKFRPFCSDQFKKVCNRIESSADIHTRTVSLCTVMYISQWFAFDTDFFEREVYWLLSRSTDLFFWIFKKSSHCGQRGAAPLGSPAPSGAGSA